MLIIEANRSHARSSTLHIKVQFEWVINFIFQKVDILNSTTTASFDSHNFIVLGTSLTSYIIDFLKMFCKTEMLMY